MDSHEGPLAGPIGEAGDAGAFDAAVVAVIAG